MNISDLKREYMRIKNEKYKYRAKVLKKEYPNSIEVQYYIERLE